MLVLQEIQFLEDIRKNLDPASKACFTSALCVSDTLRAVSFIPPEHDVIARLITGDMADALSVRVPDLDSFASS